MTILHGKTFNKVKSFSLKGDFYSKLNFIFKGEDQILLTDQSFDSSQRKIPDDVFREKWEKGKMFIFLPEHPPPSLPIYRDLLFEPPRAAFVLISQKVSADGFLEIWFKHVAST